MELFRHHWLFTGLTEHEWQKLAATAIRQRAAAGEMLFRRDDPTPGLHLVDEGAIRIFTITPEGEERTVDLIGPGEFCGEMGLVDAAPSGAWGAALGPTRLWVIPAAAFQQVLLASPAICLKLCQVLVAKLRAAGRQLDETLFLSSRQRVLRQLVRLAERHGQPYTGGLRIAIPLTHQAIACLAGTGRATVSRLLSELQERGLVRARQRRLTLADMGALRQEAGLTE